MDLYKAGHGPVRDRVEHGTVTIWFNVYLGPSNPMHGMCLKHKKRVLLENLSLSSI